MGVPRLGETVHDRDISTAKSTLSFRLLQRWRTQNNPQMPRYVGLLSCLAHELYPAIYTDVALATGPDRLAVVGHGETPKLTGYCPIKL